jgi:hypothetical protein
VVIEHVGSSIHIKAGMLDLTYEIGIVYPVRLSYYTRPSLLRMFVIEVACKLGV